jgi:penicillin amidase
MQLDINSLPGKRYAAHFNTFRFEDARTEEARKILTDWNAVLDVNSVGGTLYKVSKHFVVKKLYEKDISDHKLIDELLGKGFHTSFGPANTFLGHNTSTLLRLIDEGENSWWIKNYGGVEKLLRDGFQVAIQWLTQKLGKDMRAWKWGRLHQIEMVHALSIKKPLDKIFNIGPFPVGGDTDTPLQTVTLVPGEFGGEIAAPSYRQIIDLSDFDKSVTVMPNGQSGNMASPYYDDQVDNWLTGNFHPMCWSRAKVEKHRKHTLILKRSE